MVFGIRKNSRAMTNSGYRGIGLARHFADKMEELGEQNNQELRGFGDNFIKNAEEFNVDTSKAIEDSNKNFEDSRNKMNSDLAAMGYTPSSNSTYVNSNAAHSNQKASMQANLQNQANKQKLNAMNNAQSQQASLYNQGYGNLTNALTSGNSAEMSANNTMGAYAQNKYNKGMDLFGDVLEIAVAGLGGV